jgi:hypothetical protein
VAVHKKVLKECQKGLKKDAKTSPHLLQAMVLAQVQESEDVSVPRLQVDGEGTLVCVVGDGGCEGSLVRCSCLLCCPMF